VQFHIQVMAADCSFYPSSCGVSFWLSGVSGSVANKDIFETVCADSDS